jgi:hypothetical protein
MTSYGQTKITFGAELSIMQNFYKKTNNENFQGIFRTDDSNRNSSFGFNFRISYLIDSETKLNVSPGIRYFKGFNPIDVSNHNASFLEFPIQLNVSLSRDWFFIAGLRFSYLYKFKREDIIYNFTPSRDINILNKANHRLFYIPKLGVATTIFNKIDLELTYNYSFSNLAAFNDPNFLAPVFTTFKNNFLQLSIIYNDLGSIFVKK